MTSQNHDLLVNKLPMDIIIYKGFKGQYTLFLRIYFIRISKEVAMGGIDIGVSEFFSRYRTTSQISEYRIGHRKDANIGLSVLKIIDIGLQSA